MQDRDVPPVATISGSAGSAAASTPPPTEATLLEQVAAGGNECSPQFTFSSSRTRLCLTPKHLLNSLKNGSIVSARWAQEIRQVLKGNLAHKLMVAKHYRIHDDFLLRNHAPSLLAYDLRQISKMVLPTVKSGPPIWTKSRTFTISFDLAM